MIDRAKHASSINWLPCQIWSFLVKRYKHMSGARKNFGSVGAPSPRVGGIVNPVESLPFSSLVVLWILVTLGQRYMSVWPWCTYMVTVLTRWEHWNSVPFGQKHGWFPTNMPPPDTGYHAKYDHGWSKGMKTRTEIHRKKLTGFQGDSRSWKLTRDRSDTFYCL